MKITLKDGSVKEYEKAGLNLIIIQCANMKEELRDIATKLFPLLK